MRKLYTVALLIGMVVAMWLMWLMVNDIGHTNNPLVVKVFGYVAFALCCGQWARETITAHQRKELWG